MDISALLHLQGVMFNKAAEMRRRMPEGADPLMSEQYVTWLEAIDFINTFTQNLITKEES